MRRPASGVAALALLLGACSQDAGDSSEADVDGPYVFEGATGGVVKRIVRTDSGLALSVEQLTPEIDVPLPGRDKPLKVRLRPIGDPPPSSGTADKIFAVSDLEGNFDPLVSLLRAGGVVDDTFGWTFGTGHVVVVGDVFDRGLHVTECLWLFYELEARAQAAGGAVHFLLGNHEVMNLTGELRDARKKYKETAALLGEKPEELYSRRTVLGRWLRTRNAILRIGDQIFVHGGISPTVADAGIPLEALNDALRTGLMADVWSRPLEGPLKLVTDGKEGPLWYRGYLKEPIDEKAMDAILTTFGVKRVVVGHTLVEKIDLRLGGRVLALDVHHAKGVNQAALFARGDWHRLLPDGKLEKLTPVK